MGIKPKPGAGGAADVNALASVLGITPRRVQQLAKEGLPQEGRGKYPIVACVQWYIRYWQERAEGHGGEGGEGGETSYGEARRRKEFALARRREFEVGEIEGNLVKRDAVRSAWFEAFRQVRDRMLNIPDRLAELLASETDPQVTHQMLSDEVREALRLSADTIRRAGGADGGV